MMIWKISLTQNKCSEVIILSLVMLMQEQEVSVAIISTVTYHTKGIENLNTLAVVVIAYKLDVVGLCGFVTECPTRHLEIKLIIICQIMYALVHA